MPVFKFALLADNEVFMTLTLNTDDPNSPQADRLVAGLQSEPVVLEITDYSGTVNIGDVWNGTSFTAGEL